MPAMDVLLHVRDDSLKQQHQAGCRRNVYRREPPEKIIIWSKAEGDNRPHDPQRGSLGNSCVSGSGGEIGEEKEGHLHLENLTRGGPLDSQKTDTEIGQKKTRGQESKAQDKNGHEAQLAPAEKLPQVGLMRIGEIRQFPGNRIHAVHGETHPGMAGRPPVMQRIPFPADSPDEAGGGADADAEKTGPCRREDQEGACQGKSCDRPHEKRARISDAGKEQGVEAEAQQCQHGAEKSQEGGGQSRPDARAAPVQKIDLSGSPSALRGSKEGDSRIRQVRPKAGPVTDPRLQNPAYHPHAEP